MSTKLDHLSGAPEPRFGPAARGCTWVGEDLKFPANFKSFAANIIAHKTKVAEEELLNPHVASLMGGRKHRADDRLQLYPRVLEALDTWKPGSFEQAGAPKDPWHKAKHAVQSRVDFELTSLWQNYEMYVKRYNDQYPFLVPSTALVEVYGEAGAAEYAKTREYLLQEPGAWADRYLSDEEAWLHDQWQRANKKGKWG